MKIIVIPVESASVRLEETGEIRNIGKGLLLYVGVGQNDRVKMLDSLYIEKIVGKITGTKLFHTETTGKIDSSLLEVKGEILCISNFTLYGNFKKGTKVDFSDGAKFEDAKEIYMILCEAMRKYVCVKTGEFGTKMRITSENLGPLNYIFEY